jgi:hypothetical protein
MNEKDLKTMINQAFHDAFGCQTEESLQVQSSSQLYTDAEDYRQKTGKRFRMTKQEMNQYGQSPEGRQQAFLARQQAGQL